MTDIVERLRGLYSREDVAEAADEIERHMREKVELAGLVAKERDEIERLRAEVEKLKAQIAATAVEVNELTLDILKWVKEEVGRLHTTP